MRANGVDAAHADLAIGTELLGADGPLAQRIEGFAPRAAQQRMADAVAAALRDAETLAVEAGTGTGKTYAYLVPVLLSGMRTVISTGTRTLQDQLFHRDLPRVREALAAPVRVALLKGRGNYLCLHRMKRARGLPAMTPDEVRAFVDHYVPVYEAFGDTVWEQTAVPLLVLSPRRDVMTSGR